MAGTIFSGHSPQSSSGLAPQPINVSRSFAAACRALGAETVYAAATHGAFVGKANATLREQSLERIVVTNTIPAFRLDDDLRHTKLEVLDTAPLFAEVIRRLNEGTSIVSLMEDG